MQNLGKEFYFMRHGRTPSNAADIIAGFTDEDLTEDGLGEVLKQAEKFRELHIGALWVSPLKRAHQTALAVQQWTNRKIHLVDELKERNWGILEGCPRADLKRDETPKNGEGPEEFKQRIRLGIGKITAPEPAVIVAHSGTAREIFALLDIPFARPKNADILNFQKTSADRWIVKEL